MPAIFKAFTPPAKVIGLLPVLLILLLITSKAEAAFSTVDCTDLTDTATLGISQAECEDLESLWTDTSGPGWSTSTNWDTTTSANSWHGVTVLGGVVTKIALPTNNLVGTLPNFTALPNLERLELHDNQLNGPIPDFSALPSLERLILAINQLSGPVPDFSALPSLEQLLLTANQLSGPIPDFSALPSLERLDLGVNQLIGPIPDFSALPGLEVLALHNNELNGAIPNFSALPSLKQLYLNFNELSGSIPDFSALPSLEWLQLHFNELSGPIPDLTGLTSLFVFEFDNNNFVFSDFEAEHSAYFADMGGFYQYAPQAIVDINRTQTVTNGINLTITPQIAVNPLGNDSYQWYKNGVLISGATSRIYAVTSASASDAGDYTYQVTNSVVGSLTLYSHSGADAIAVVMSGNCNGDSVVDILDVACVINLAKGSGLPNGNGADTEPDGDVDLADVITTIGIVLSQ